jgi:hypothetical protein
VWPLDVIFNGPSGDVFTGTGPADAVPLDVIFNGPSGDVFTGTGPADGTRRVAFERDQLAIEEAELAEVIGQSEGTSDQLRAALVNVEHDIHALEDLLRPTRVAAAAVLPPRPEHPGSGRGGT